MPFLLCLPGGAYAAKPTKPKGGDGGESGKKKMAAAKGMRRGFFDAPRKPRGAAARKTKQKEGMVELRGKKPNNTTRSVEDKIPEWMKIDPNSDQAKLMQMKEKVKEAC